MGWVGGGTERCSGLGGVFIYRVNSNVDSRYFKIYEDFFFFRFWFSFENLFSVKPTNPSFGPKVINASFCHGKICWDFHTSSFYYDGYGCLMTMHSQERTHLSIFYCGLCER